MNPMFLQPGDSGGGGDFFEGLAGIIGAIISFGLATHIIRDILGLDGFGLDGVLGGLLIIILGVVLYVTFALALYLLMHLVVALFYVLGVIVPLIGYPFLAIMRVITESLFHERKVRKTEISGDRTFDMTDE